MHQQTKTLLLLRLLQTSCTLSANPVSGAPTARPPDRPVDKGSCVSMSRGLRRTHSSGCSSCPYAQATCCNVAATTLSAGGIIVLPHEHNWFEGTAACSVQQSVCACSVTGRTLRQHQRTSAVQVVTRAHIFKSKRRTHDTHTHATRQMRVPALYAMPGRIRLHTRRRPSSPITSHTIQRTLRPHDAHTHARTGAAGEELY